MAWNIPELVTGAVVPLLAVFAFTLPLLAKIFGEKKFPGIWSLIASVVAAVMSTYIFTVVWSTGKDIVYGFGGWPPPIGISYEVDPFNAVIAVFTAWIMVLITIYSLWYNRHFDEPEWYYILLIGLEAGMLGCLYTGDAFNLFVMIEVLGISAYALVAYHKNRGEAIEAAIKYGIIGATATTLYFIGLVIIYGVYGTLNMGQLSLLSAEIYYRRPDLIASIGVATLLAVSLALWVFTYKSALFPNHFWLPDAHPEAPTPVSAALSGLVVNIGVYAVARFMYTIFGPASTIAPYYRDAVLTALFIMGFAGAFIGAIMMMAQKDLKRLLAYSTVSHTGLLYMALAIGMSGVPQAAVALGLAAMTYHVLTHGLGKALLFMSSGVFIDSAGTRDLDGLAGVGRKYPLVSASFIIGFLSLMGLLPLGGFFSKLMLYQAFMDAGMLIPALAVIVVSAISVLGYAKAMYSVVFATPIKEHREIKLHGIHYMLALMAVGLILLGVLYPWISQGLVHVANSSLIGSGVREYQEAFVRAFHALLGR